MNQPNPYAAPKSHVQIPEAFLAGETDPEEVYYDPRITGAVLGFLLSFSIPMWSVLLIVGNHGPLVFFSMVVGAVVFGGIGAAVGFKVGSRLHQQKEQAEADAKVGHRPK